MDLTTIWMVCTTLAFPIIGYFYTDLKKKVEKNSEDILTDKLYTSLHYVSKDELKQTVDNLNNNIRDMKAGLLRIEGYIFSGAVERRSRD